MWFLFFSTKAEFFHRKSGYSFIVKRYFALDIAAQILFGPGRAEIFKFPGFLTIARFLDLPFNLKLCDM